MTGRVSLPRGWKERWNGKAQQRRYWQSVSKAASRRENSRDNKKKKQTVPQKRKNNILAFPSYVAQLCDNGCWWLTTETRPEGGSSMGQNLAHMISALQNMEGWFITEGVQLKPRKQQHCLFLTIAFNQFAPEEVEWYRVGLSKCLPLLLGCWKCSWAGDQKSKSASEGRVGSPRCDPPSLPIFRKALQGSEQIENNRENVEPFPQQQVIFSVTDEERVYFCSMWPWSYYFWCQAFHHCRQHSENELFKRYPVSQSRGCKWHFPNSI